MVDRRLVAAVERKSLADLVSSLINGKLRYALGDLAALPRAAVVVVEDRYSQVFKLDWVRPAVVADGLADLQIRWPSVPIVFSEARQLAEEWTYRYLAAAHAWANTDSRPRRTQQRRGGQTGDGNGPPARRSRQPAKSANGRAPKESPCPIVAGFAPTSGKHGATPSNRDHPTPHKITKTTRSAPLLSRPHLRQHADLTGKIVRIRTPSRSAMRRFSLIAQSLLLLKVKTTVISYQAARPTTRMGMS
jgi:ERCC4 domain